MFTNSSNIHVYQEYKKYKQIEIKKGAPAKFENKSSPSQQMARTRNMKIKPKKRSDENTASMRNESSRKNNQITYESQKRKTAKFHLEHISEIKRCKELIKNKKKPKGHT